MSKFFTKKKVIILIVAVALTVMVGVIIGNNIASTMKAKERAAEKAKVEKTVEERKEKEEKIKKAESDKPSEEENYSEEYKEYIALSDEEKKKVEAIPRKEKIKYSQLKIIKEDQKEDLGKEYVLEEDKQEDEDKEVLPKKFNLKDKINVVVEDQGQFGLCWDFASVKSLETNLALTKGEYYDISESHIDYMTSNLVMTSGRDENSGGNFYNVKIYNEQNKGFVLEEEVPLNVYEDYEYNTFYYTPKENIYITKYAEFPSIYRDENMSQEEYDTKFKEFQTAVKTHIMNYGSLYASIVAPDYGKNHYMKAYKDAENNRGYHAISIVGWDDNYDRNNFRSPNGNVPEKDGAYIALNSWGEDWGDKGYFYISYEDFSVNSQMSGIVSVNEIEDLIDISNLRRKARDFVRNNYSDSIVVIEGKEYLRKDSINGWLDLSNLDLDTEDIEDFEIFLSRASDINLSNNNIKDVSSLKNLKLESLKLDGNYGVIGFDELDINYSLSLKNCGVTSIGNIDNLKELSALYLSGNRIEDYSKIANMENLYYLDLSDNGLETLANVKDLLKMESLNCINLSKNNLKDISELEDASIYEIDLSYNTEITDYEPVRKLKDTYVILLEGCNIKDAKDVYIESITEEEIEKANELLGEDYFEDYYFGISYHLSNNKGITNLKALRNASVIQLEDCDLGDISELKEIKELRYVDLSHNYNLTGDLSGMNLSGITLIDCNLNDDFNLFNVESVKELNIEQNNIKNIDKLINKVVWTIYMDTYDGERDLENGPYIQVKFDDEIENSIVIEIPDENNLDMNVASYMHSNKISISNMEINGKRQRYSVGVIPVNEDTTISYFSYGKGTTTITFKVNSNLESDGIMVRYNPYMARLKDENEIIAENLRVANTYDNFISKETHDFSLDNNIYKVEYKFVEREYLPNDKSYIYVPEKYYAFVTQGDFSAKYTVRNMSGFNVIDEEYDEDLTPPEDFEGEFTTLTFSSEELYYIAKDYWDGLYVRADDDLLIIELKEYRERNDSGLPMYIPRRLLWDTRGLKPIMLTDIYILMDDENGMDIIENEDLEQFDEFTDLDTIHIVTPVGDKYIQDDLIVPQDKYTVVIENGVG